MSKPVDKWDSSANTVRRRYHRALAKGGTDLRSRPLPNTPVSVTRLHRWTGHKRASMDQVWARNRGDSSLHWRNTWKVHRISTWLSSHGKVHGKVHDGPQETWPSMQCMSAFLGGVSDAASCKSVGYTGGTGDIFTNCHLLVFACGYLQYHVLLLCNPSYSGEYRINFISSLILPILSVNYTLCVKLYIIVCKITICV